MLDLTIDASKTRATVGTSLDKIIDTMTVETTTIGNATDPGGRKTAIEVEATITPRTASEGETTTLTSTTGTSGISTVKMPATKTNLN